MNSIRTLLRIVRRDAIEHAGIQEVPDDKHGSNQNYHDAKRGARDDHFALDLAPGPSGADAVVFNLDVIADAAGHLAWSDAEGGQ